MSTLDPAIEMVRRLGRATLDLDARLSRLEALDEGLRSGRVVLIRPNRSSSPGALSGGRETGAGG